MASNRLNDAFLKEHMMGPNAVKILEESIKGLPLDAAERILDLGCGKGLTSIYLAERFSAAVFTADLWIPATENYERFLSLGLADRIVPLHAEATDLPFADAYFDAAVCIDAYHYFGRDQAYMDRHLAPLVKPGGYIVLAVPGLKRELSELPPEFAVCWTAEDMETLHGCDWWRAVLAPSRRIEIVSIRELNCYEEAWNDWLASDNPYAVSDRRAMEAGAGKLMNLVAIVCRRV